MKPMSDPKKMEESMSKLLIEQVRADGYEQVHSAWDEESGLRAIIAIHDTTLGPALGGVRMRAYQDEATATADCMALAKAMTLKAAAAGLHLGGGASVVIGDSVREKTDDLLAAHGRFVATFGGRFIPVNDIGTTQTDIAVIGRYADPVCAEGDPSPMTALGVLEGIRACRMAVDGTESLVGLRVCVQGVGNVGRELARILIEERATVLVADVDEAKVAAVAAELGATAVDPERMLQIECDVLAPCATGGVITEETLQELRCRIVAGGANNVLSVPEHTEALASRQILYVPDFCVNAGGLIYLEQQILGRDQEHAEREVRQIGNRVAEVLDKAYRDGITPTAAAVMLANTRLQ